MQAALEAWDTRCGAAPWDVVYAYIPRRASEMSPGEAHSIQPVIEVLQNVHVAPGITGENASEEDLNELFEWVGMACLGSQRCVSEYSR